MLGPWTTSLREQLFSQTIHNITWFLRGVSNNGIIRRLLKRRELRLDQVRIHKMSLSLPESTLDHSWCDLEIHKDNPIRDMQMLTIHPFQG
jgi:hypothetical protein